MQIIKFKWENWEPRLILQDNASLQKIVLFDNDLELKLGEKLCIGYFKAGKHYKCPYKNKTEFEYSCSDCQRMDDFFRCIKCNGSSCINEKMRKECTENNYFIYLAAFNTLLKVGISHEQRIMKRLVEQGADFGAKIAFVKDGKNVRETEQKVKNHLHITDRITGNEKQDMLFANPNLSVIRLSNAINKLKGNGFPLIHPEIYDMRKYYRLENTPSKPKKIDIKTNTKIKGRVVSAKGNILVLENKNNFYSLNAHALIGREILSI